MHGARQLLLAAIALGAASVAAPFDNADCMLCHGDAGLFDLALRPGLLVHDATFVESAHGSLACTDCHSGIVELPHAEKLAPVDCSVCHAEQQAVYATSAHARVESATADAASCVSCHGVHDIFPADDIRSTVHHHNLAATCIRCHEDQALIERHDLPSGETIDSYVYSVHGQANVGDPASKAATCNDCHGWHDIKGHHDPDSKVSRHNVVKTCGACHQDVLNTFYRSVHGGLVREGNPDAPVCTDCHGEHQIQSHENRASTASKYQIADTCGKCHEDPAIVLKYDIPISAPTTFYKESVHGKALLSGKNEAAAACHDCHGYHEILRGSDPQSSVYRANIPETCAKCHTDDGVFGEYQRSVHGQALKRGVRESPVCTDCHGEHTIMDHLDPESPVYATRLAKETCGRCHDSLVINRKYGMPTDTVSTYLESYHGLASRLGDTKVANCVSCHGVHEVLRSSDPGAMTHPDNLLATCAACHPNANEKFIAGKIHASRATHEAWIIPLISKIYIWLIAVTIGGMLFHNLLIIFRHIRDKYHKQRHVPYVQRFPRAAIIQHLFLTISFILLVITGFSLKFPDSLFSQFFGGYLGLTEALRSTVHRAAGVVLAGTLIWHLASMVFTRRGRAEVAAFMLGPRDAVHVVQNVGFHLGLAKDKPKFDRYDYSEKLEYWAFIWGGVIMVVTGFLLWFPAWAGQLGLSRLWIEVAKTIHYYEAWLATLAILVWHFFFVLFHPEEYPMSMSWLTGKLPVSEMEERHPLELERLRAEGKIIYPQGAPEGGGETPQQRPREE